MLNMTVYDYKSKREYMFCCTVRRRKEMTEDEDEGVLSVGWIEFVRRKNLKPCDKVIFYDEVDDTGKATLKIEVKRRIRLFGHDIWAQIP